MYHQVIKEQIWRKINHYEQKNLGFSMNYPVHAKKVISL